jgi:hypothetical protein
MCIICNVGDVMENVETAEQFLSAFAGAQKAMKTAADKMLEVSKIACTADDRKRYDAIHKEMVRQIREWNRLEQKREHA